MVLCGHEGLPTLAYAGNPEFAHCLEGPTGIPEKLAPEQHHVGLSLGEDGLGLGGAGEESDRAGGDARASLDGRGKGHLEARACLDNLGRNETA